MTFVGWHLRSFPSEPVTYARLHEAVSVAGINTFQLFITPSTNGQPGTKLDKTEATQIRKWIQSSGYRGFVHGKYIYNFCRAECNHHIDQLVAELDLANDIGCDVVIHQGRNVDGQGLTRLEALHNYVAHITEVLERTPHCSNHLLLENSAHQGSELGYSLDELVYIYNQFDESIQDRVGFCIDLCHIFVAGELDLRLGKDTQAFLEKFTERLDASKLKCIHYNDSSVAFNGHRDHHGDVGCGYISNPLLGGSIEGLRLVAQYASKHSIPIIFETPSMFADDQLSHQREIVKGWQSGDDTIYKAWVVSHSAIQQQASDHYNGVISKSKSKTKPQLQPKLPLLPAVASLDSASSSSSGTAKTKIQLKLKAQPRLIVSDAIDAGAGEDGCNCH